MIFAFFGYNESFAGKAGLDKFKDDLDAFIKHTLDPEVQRQDAPRGSSSSRRSRTRTCTTATCPTAGENNARLEALHRRDGRGRRGRTASPSSTCSPRRSTLYAEGRQAADDQRHPPDRRGQPPARAGHRRGPVRRRPRRTATRQALEKLRQAVLDKNFYWFNRYRTVDGYSIYGGRADLAVRRRPDQPRGRPARDGSPRRDDRQPRQAHLGRRAGRATSRSTTANTPPFIPVDDQQAGHRARTASTSSSTARRRSRR